MLLQPSLPATVAGSTKMPVPMIPLRTSAARLQRPSERTSAGSPGFRSSPEASAGLAEEVVSARFLSSSFDLARNEIELQVEHPPAPAAVRGNHLAIVDPANTVGPYHSPHSKGWGAMLVELCRIAFIARIIGRESRKPAEPLTEMVLAGLSGWGG
jgi:hypothetical protein